MDTPNTHAPSTSTHLALSRLCESLRSASEALLLQCDYRPTATDDVWYDPLSAQTLPFAQALSKARNTAEKDRSLRSFARPLDELEETIVRAAGWEVFAKTGGIGWCPPDGSGRVPRTRSEAVEVIRRQIEGKG